MATAVAAPPARVAAARFGIVEAAAAATAAVAAFLSAQSPECCLPNVRSASMAPARIPVLKVSMLSFHASREISPDSDPSVQIGTGSQ